jgi:hypothetical protein
MLGGWDAFLSMVAGKRAGSATPDVAWGYASMHVSHRLVGAQGASVFLSIPECTLQHGAGSGNGTGGYGGTYASGLR